jgi:hypothetical protein
MIKMTTDKTYKLIYNRTGDGVFYIDLKGCTTKQQVLEKLASVLTAEKGATLVNDSLDALNDVMGDWFYEKRNMETKYSKNMKYIILDNFHHISTIDTLLPFTLLNIMHSAYLSALRNMQYIGNETVKDRINAFDSFRVIAICID